MLSTKLQTVLAVAEYKKFTRAAEELNMTQPAVSHHIKQLEQEVDAPLFVRNKADAARGDRGELRPPDEGAP
jgi:DNA-binding transcriptional LysR family regulator